MPARLAPDPRRRPVPLILLTGFLGAGKTTLLNRVLGFQHHRRVAVLVNELGRIDIDAGLIRGRAGDVLELTGGCVCHQIGVQRELWSALEEVVRRSRPDVVVLETTGIAEPEEIWNALAELRRERASDHPGGDPDEDRDQDRVQDQDGGWFCVGRSSTVTVVDATAGPRQIERHAEARAQIRAADRILLSKLEDTLPELLGPLHQTLHQLNPAAERASFPAGASGTAALAAWLLDTSLRMPGSSSRPQAPGRAHAPHQLAAATFVDQAPLNGEALLLVCRALGERLVRAKGPVHLGGESRRGFLEKAGTSLHLDLRQPWGVEPPLTRLVLIGEDLDEAAIHRQLWACRATV